MRVYTNQFYRVNAEQMQSTQSKVAEIQAKLGSGKQMLHPSEDPGKANLISGLVSAKERQEVYSKNVDAGETRLTAESAVLESMTSIMQRITQLAVQSSNDTLKSSRLNQEIAGLMLVISNDVRRAGYWENVGDLPFGLNPFNQPGATALVVRDNMTNDMPQAPTGQGSCITYAYDATYLPGNTAGTVDSNDLFGFRLNGGVVEMRQSGTVDGVARESARNNRGKEGLWKYGAHI